jgi:carbon monoxide dehydrogenase subunit G
VAASASIEVGRPPAEVFAYVIDPSRFVEWQEGIVDGHMQSDGPQAVGDSCHTTRRVGPAKRAVTSEVTHVDPPRTWGVRSIDGPIRAAVKVTVEPVGGNDRSRVTIDLDFVGYGIGKLLVPLVVRPQARKEMAANMQRLKQRLEVVQRSPGG